MRVVVDKAHYASYDMRPVTSEKDKLALIIAPDGSTPASINQDAWFSSGNLDAGQVKEYKLQVGSVKPVCPQIDKMIGYSPLAAAHFIHYIAVVAVTFQHYHLID